MSASSVDRSATVRGVVLVVDDEEPNRDQLHDLLGTQGYQVIEAADGEQALQLAEEKNPDAILLDVMMPGINGFEVCRRLKADDRTTHIPVLMVTALIDRRDRLQGIEAGANDFLNKPVDAQEMLLRVRNAVYAKQLFDENLSYQRQLEQKVEERTAELRQAHARLQQQVKELEGRDRLVHFQMSGAPLHEAYEEILLVLARVLEVERIVIYRSDTIPRLEETRARLKPVAAMGWAGTGRVTDARQLQEVPGGEIEDQGALVARAVRQRRLQQDGEGAAVPILYHEEVMGGIWVEGLDAEEDESALESLWRFGGEAALVLRMAQVAEDLDGGKVDLDELLEMEG